MKYERGGHHYGNEAPFLFAPFLATILLVSICSGPKNIQYPVSSDEPASQPTPDLLAFRKGAKCQEIMANIQDGYNKMGLAPYDGKYYLIANPLDGSALRVLVLTSREKFEHDVRNFDSKLREKLSKTDVEHFPVRYYRVAQKIEGGGAIVDENIESIALGEKGNGLGCFTSPAPASPAASSSAR